MDKIPNNQNPRVTSEMYQAFVSLWIHQDQQMWNRVTWALTIEIALVAGSFAKPGQPGALIIAAGSIILLFLGLMFRKDARDREQALKIIDRFHQESGFSFPAARILAEPEGKWTSGRRLVQGIAAITVLLNAALLIAHILYSLGGDHGFLQLVFG